MKKNILIFWWIFPKAFLYEMYRQRIKKGINTPIIMITVEKEEDMRGQKIVIKARKSTERYN